VKDDIQQVKDVVGKCCLRTQTPWSFFHIWMRKIWVLYLIKTFQIQTATALFGTEHVRAYLPSLYTLV